MNSTESTSPSAGSITLPETTDVAILGAGPTGLDAALAVASTGRSFVVLEQGPRAANGIRSWGSVRLFSPWSMNVSDRMRSALGAVNQAPPNSNDCPTGHEFCEQALDPVAALPSIAPHLLTSTRVIAIGRHGLLKREEIGTARRAQQTFRLLLETDTGEHVLRAKVVLDCTGGQHQPSWLGNGGIPAPGERQLGPDVLVRGIEKFLATAPRENEHILLVGAGHSAQTAAVALADAPVDVTWVLRGGGESIVPIEGDPLPERSALQAKARALLDGSNDRFTIHRNTTVEHLEHAKAPDLAEGAERLHRVTVLLQGAGGEPSTRSVTVDRIVALVGSMGDQQLYRELQVQECYATAGPFALAAALLGEAEPSAEGGADCLAQVSQGPKTLLTPEPGYFILGNKSYGRNNAFLLRIGYQQIDDVLTLI